MHRVFFFLLQSASSTESCQVHGLSSVYVCVNVTWDLLLTNPKSRNDNSYMRELPNRLGSGGVESDGRWNWIPLSSQAVSEIDGWCLSVPSNLPTCLVSPECLHAQQPHSHKAPTRSFSLCSVFTGRNRAQPSFQSHLKGNWLTSLTHWLSHCDSPSVHHLWKGQSSTVVVKSREWCDNKPQTFSIFVLPPSDHCLITLSCFYSCLVSILVCHY